MAFTIKPHTLEDRIKNLETLVLDIILAAGSIVLLNHFANIWVKLALLGVYGIFSGLALPRVFVAGYYASFDWATTLGVKINTTTKWFVQQYRKHQRWSRILLACLAIVGAVVFLKLDEQQLIIAIVADVIVFLLIGGNTSRSAQQQ